MISILIIWKTSINVYGKNLLALILTSVVFISQTAFSQESKIASVVGEWMLSSIKITSLSPDNTIDESNCYWADVKKIDKPVSFHVDGTVSFYKILDSEVPTRVTAMYEVSDTELKIIFYNGTASVKGNEEEISKSNVQSYTSYNFSIHNNNSRLVLTNQYPLLMEKYIFTKKLN